MKQDEDERASKQQPVLGPPPEAKQENGAPSIRVPGQDVIASDLDRPSSQDELPLESVPESRPEDEQASLEQLKMLLLESERVAIGELRRAVDENRIGAGELSQMLPLAIRQAAHRDEQLATALGPTLANSFQDSVKRNPKALADAISPIMGPAIRRAIGQAISGMMQSLNQTIEHSFSWNGLKWRWQALTTSRPFAEVVLLNAFAYRVEQIFLIHRNDGLLLAQASTAKAGSASADLVSGMLTAIQDFVRQSFGAGEGESMESMQVGDSHVWVIPSPHAFLAAVIRGVPRKELRNKFQEQLESIHAEYSEQLADYDGDNAPFEMLEPQLEACLFSEARHMRTGKPSRARRLVPVAVLLVPLLLMSWLVYQGARQIAARRDLQRIERSLQIPATASFTFADGQVIVSGTAEPAWIQRARLLPGVVPQLDAIDLSQVQNLHQSWHDCLQALRDEPGIVVLEASITDDEYVVSGLRDPDARDPQSIMDRYALNLRSVRASWEPYHSMELPFLLQRAEQGFPPSESVHWTRQENRLTAEGTASRQWLLAARAYAIGLGHQIEVDLSHVVNHESQALRAACANLEGTSILFAADSSELTEIELAAIERIAADVADVQRLARQAQEPVDIIVVGYLDRKTDREPAGVARARANSVWRALQSAGAQSRGLFVRNGGYFKTDDQSPHGRRCVVSVKLRES